MSEREKLSSLLEDASVLLARVDVARRTRVIPSGSLGEQAEQGLELTVGNLSKLLSMVPG